MQRAGSSEVQYDQSHSCSHDDTHRHISVELSTTCSHGEMVRWSGTVPSVSNVTCGICLPVALRAEQLRARSRPELSAELQVYSSKPLIPALDVCLSTVNVIPYLPVLSS